jgi:phosphate transport system protein
VPVVVDNPELERLTKEVVELFAYVGEGLAGATDAFLSGDRDRARRLVASDELIDSLYHDIEAIVQTQFASGRVGGDDLRLLVSVLRIVPELERSGDLAEHIAQRAARGLGFEVTPRARGLVAQMGEVCNEMWRVATDAFVERDADAADRLNLADDRLDDLHVSLTAEVASGALSLPVAMEMALVARFYERLGDHAVNVAERVRFLALGTSD